MKEIKQKANIGVTVSVDIQVNGMSINEWEEKVHQLLLSLEDVKQAVDKVNGCNDITY